ncbi:class E sortase [Glycomyces buryatensis]|uniref:Class E sortase n=1 Tax=Glycomyces buryatensis TaxID=2570927 RepID=A0A4S8QLJ5_9ACTN|nr:class E sortase [Glycomyces buryatensis]THV41604.1 class E sortase [Glycomyces buryatensis]
MTPPGSGGRARPAAAPEGAPHSPTPSPTPPSPTPPNATPPGRAKPPSPGTYGQRPPAPRPGPGPSDHDRTTALRPPSAAKPERAPLVPEPDGTAILPQIMDGAAAPPGSANPGRKKRTVKRHRAEAAARGTIRGIGEILISFGAIVLLYAAYEVFGVTTQINNEQQTLSTDLDSNWDSEAEGETIDGAPVPELGDVFARMWAPDIRPESWTLVEGTEPTDIEYAPGRFEEGAYPGEQGNFTLAGHNVPAIFTNIRDLRAGDKVVIETKEYFYVYEVREDEVVNETEVDITAPVPGEPETEPGDDDYWLTLFTCHPRWDNYERYVVYSQLIETYERDPEGDLPDEAVDPEA